MGKSLVALDTDHIKEYVFGTDKLKEIRGASSILDKLNRDAMGEVAREEDPRAEQVYANGGSGLFLVDTAKADGLGKAIQREYRVQTAGGATITYAVQHIPKGKNPWKDDIRQELELLRHRLRQNKDRQPDLNEIALFSHPFIRPCDACGVEYAEETQSDQDDPDEPEGRYCRVCLRKREEDIDIKTRIPNLIRAAREGRLADKTLWGRILESLNPSDKSGYDLSGTPKRPRDFNVFSNFTSGKDYLGLIYADANGMGKALETQSTLQEVQEFAEEVDKAVFKAMGYAIREHLPVQKGFFPFDILLIGGDDIVMVTTAAKALQVAYTIAEQFHIFTKQKYTLSVGVVLAPIKYPFNLQQTLADETLKAAKKAGSANDNSQRNESRINFVVVTGSTSLSYQKIYQELHRKKVPYGNEDEFYATLRPYTLSQLKDLLAALRKGNKERLGRTKLHQLREAILKLNRTTTILEALSLRRNWKQEEQVFIKQLVDKFDTRSAKQQKVTGTLFPWFLDGKATYRTPLLDFIELYDFVSSEERV